MSIIITSTTQLPELAGNHERTVAVKITSGTVDVQFKAGNDWITAKQYTADGVDRIYLKGSVVRIVISAVATVEVGD